MKTVKTRLAALAILMGLAAPAAAQNLEFTAGSPGGAWFTQATGIAAILQEKYPGLSVRVVPGGGRDNPSKIQGGISQMGFGIDFLSYAALHGAEPYDAPHDKLTSMGSTGVDVQFMVYAAPEETRDMAALLSSTDIRLGITPASTSEYLNAIRVLEFYGNSPDKIRAGGGTVTIASYGDLVSAYGDGQIDVIFGAGEIPSGVAAQVVAGPRKAKLLGFPQGLINYMKATYSTGQGVLPAGTYPDLQTEDLPVVTMGNIYLVSADVPEDVVYQMTKIIIENEGRLSTIYQAMDAYDPSIHWQVTIPLHPGAERAFREAGYIK